MALLPICQRLRANLEGVFGKSCLQAGAGGQTPPQELFGHANVIGIDLNPSMCRKAAANASATRTRSAVVPQFRFRKPSTQASAEAFGVKAVMMTAVKPMPA
jgi:hypothetical protein